MKPDRHLRRAVLLLVLGLAATSLLGCDLTKFVIKKGAHYSTQRVRLFTRDTLKFSVLFDDSAVYSNVDPVNQADINKLYGFSDCTSFHHDNSARFGWRWFHERLEILAYTYVDGARQSQLLGTATIGQPSEYELRIDGGSYVFTFDGHSVTMPRGCDGGGGPKYMLWPYFGGDEVAPHEVTIIVQEDR